MGEGRGVFRGWRLVGWAAAILILICALLLATAGFTERGVSLVIRTTAQTSFVLFLAAFSAASLLKFFPNGVTRWLRSNRRYLGVSFAVSHLLHAAAILTLGVVTGGRSLAATDAATLVGGGLAYVFILAMAATSFDGAVRQLGQRRWTLLHTAGMYYIWFIFMFSYGGRAVDSLAYATPALLLVLALMLRLAASVQAKVLARRAPAARRA